jgi:hypothetical protein
VASQRIELALAQVNRANVLWLPTIYYGTDYFRHDGQIQDVAGKVFGNSRAASWWAAAPAKGFTR